LKKCGGAFAGGEGRELDPLELEDDLPEEKVRIGATRSIARPMPGESWIVAKGTPPENPELE
jgi:hypothetical protein